MASGIGDLRHKGARRDQPRRDIGIVKRVQHAPQHIALERKRIDHRLLLFGVSRMPFHPFEREIGIALGLRRTLVEVGQ